MWNGANQPAVRRFVEEYITAGEGFKDEILIDMVMRRLTDAPDSKAFEQSVSILMGDRAGGFTTALSGFLGNAKNISPIERAPVPSSKAQGKMPMVPPGVVLPNQPQQPQQPPPLPRHPDDEVDDSEEDGYYDEEGEEEYDDEEGEEEEGEEEYYEDESEGEEEYEDEGEEEPGSSLGPMLQPLGPNKTGLEAEEPPLEPELLQQLPKEKAAAEGWKPPQPQQHPDQQMTQQQPRPTFPPQQRLVANNVQTEAQPSSSSAAENLRAVWALSGGPQVGSDLMPLHMVRQQQQQQQEQQQRSSTILEQQQASIARSGGGVPAGGTGADKENAGSGSDEEPVTDPLASDGLGGRLSPSAMVSLRLSRMGVEDGGNHSSGGNGEGEESHFQKGEREGDDPSCSSSSGSGSGCSATANGSSSSSACCASSTSTTTTPRSGLSQASVAMGNAWGVAVCNSAQCAVACDGIEQAYLPTPLSDPPMADEEIDQLREWLSEVSLWRASPPHSPSSSLHASSFVSHFITLFLSLSCAGCEATVWPRSCRALRSRRPHRCRTTQLPPYFHRIRRVRVRARLLAPKRQSKGRKEPRHYTQQQ